MDAQCNGKEYQENGMNGDEIKSAQKLVIIYWEDCASHGFEQYLRADAEKLSSVQCVSVGVLIADTPERITLALEWFYEGDDFRHCITIPRRQVRSVWATGLTEATGQAPWEDERA